MNTNQRALESDTAAREANNNELTTLLLLRHASLMSISADHPHREAITQARDSAELEIRYRLEKAQEYQEMAALACFSLDMLNELNKSPDLKEHVRLMKEDKDSLIADPEKRKRQYAAHNLVFAAAQRPHGQKTPNP